MKIFASILVSILTVGSGVPHIEEQPVEEVKEVAVVNSQTWLQEDTSLQTWLWDATYIKKESAVADLRDQGISTVYLNAGWEPKEKEFYLKENPKLYSSFIQKANQKGIEIEALYGNPEWALKENLSSLKGEVQTVLNYNKKNKNAKFTAIHLDIEPHLFPNWKGNEVSLLNEMVANLKEVRKQIDTHNKKTNDQLKLAIDVPAWYTQYEIDGGVAHKVLLEIVDEVGVMHYTKNEDYYLEGAIPYLEVAAMLNKQVSIGSEFQNDYAEVSLATMPMEWTKAYLEEGVRTFNEYPSFKGLALHEFHTFSEYVDKQ